MCYLTEASDSCAMTGPHQLATDREKNYHSVTNSNSSNILATIGLFSIPSMRYIKANIHNTEGLRSIFSQRNSASGLYSSLTIPIVTDCLSRSKFESVTPGIDFFIKARTLKDDHDVHFRFRLAS